MYRIDRGVPVPVEYLMSVRETVRHGVQHDGLHISEPCRSGKECEDQYEQ